MTKTKGNLHNASMRRLIRRFKWTVAEGRLSPEIPQALAIVPRLRKGKAEARETDPVLPVEDALVDATLPQMPPMLADMGPHPEVYRLQAGGSLFDAIHRH